MNDPISELKVRAEVLHRSAQNGNAAALTRLRGVPELRKATDADLSLVRRKHCLTAVAKEVGFESWRQARHVLGGATDEGGFGRMLSTPGGFLNQWFASYEEARAVQRELLARKEASYLLAYQRQFFLTERGYIDALGLDPDDSDWQEIGWDWAEPLHPPARSRLYGKLLASRPTPAART
jgi:hypothetical protein